MATATIRYDVDTAGWPPEAHLVELDPPLRRYNPEDGAPVDYPHVVVCVRHPDRYGIDNAGVDVFPSTDEAGFVHETMIPVARKPYGVLHSALRSLGYDVTN